MTYREHPILPPIPTGYDLYRCGSNAFGIIIPCARRNEVTNPSAETNTTGYTAGAGSLARTTADQYHGAYSLQYIPSAAVNDGFYYGTISMTAGQTRAISCKFKGAGGRPYKLSVATTGGTDLASYKFRASGRWQWIWLFWTETSTTSRRIYFTKDNDTNVLPFCVDGVQSEVCGSEGVFVTTYIDGDQQGLVANQFPPAYYWEGTPHASASQRSGQTRAGGRVLTLDRYGIVQTGVVGLGLTPPQHIANQYAQLDGSNYDRTRKPQRQFSLIGRVSSPDPVSLQDLRADLGAQLDRDKIAQQQPLMLRYQQYHPDGTERGAAALIPALYAGGLDGNTNNDYAEDLAISFLQEQPGVLEERTQGASLTVQQALSAPDRFILRRPDGTWAETGGVGAGTVWAVLWARDGKCYVAGSFTTVDGGTSANRIAAYDPATDAWTTFGTGAAGGDVLAIAEGPDGRIYIAGQFTSVNGVANTRGIAVLTPSTGTWAAVGAGGSGDVFNIAFQKTGNLIAIGAISGVSGTSSVASWNGSAWSAVGASFVSDIALAIAPDNTIYVGGTNDVKYWTGSAWVTIGTVTGGVARLQGLAFGPNGILYATGGYTAIGGISANCVAMWNGQQWTPMGTGVSGSSPQAYRVFALPNGEIYIGGVGITSANGVTLPNGAARWTGSTWVPLDVIFSGTANLYAASLKGDGTLALGYFSGSIAAAAAGITTVTNNGSVRSYPTLILRGPSSGSSRIYQVINTTTGRALYLNYTILAGETAMLVLPPDNLRFTSDFQGNLISIVLPGSNEADYFLQPGSNILSVLSVASSVTATLQWQPSFATLDDLIRVA